MASDGDTRLVLTSVEGGVGILRLNRADKRNAMSADLARELHEAIEALDANPEVVAVVVTGSGGSFSAGADMNESLAAYERGDRGFNPSARAAARVAASPKPTIAAIEGPSYGAGALLACACDIRLVAPNARFRFPGAEYGLVVGAAALPTLVGPALAKELLYSARVVDAEEAVRIGLANRIVAADDLESEALTLARAIAQASPLALGWIKRVVNAAASGGDAAGLEVEADLMLRGGPDHVARFSAATNRITGRGGN
ncbi:MAG: enoyl-CoA hydratase/isomerase family protein [Dehalococcoidia bacterium]|nr:enoyl-CoA hydratase/isomerase family protein [Dehalococcoidia bacterium]